MARKATKRTAVPPGDDLGAAELTRRIATNIKSLRQARGMSLDDLAGASGVSRAGLSQIETCKTNPSLGVVWKIAVGFGIPFSDLLGETAAPIAVLRRADMQVLRSTDGKFESRPLTTAGSSPLVDVYELRLAARSSHASDAHVTGTREVIIVLSGALKMHVEDAVHELSSGDSIFFPADRAHTYENPGGSEGRYHNIILYGR